MSCLLFTLYTDCSKLYALKSAHCRLVIPRENQLQKLKRESVVVGEDGSMSYGGNETIVKQIEAELLEDYKRYQVADSYLIDFSAVFCR